MLCNLERGACGSGPALAGKPLLAAAALLALGLFCAIDLVATPQPAADPDGTELVAVELLR